MRVRVNIGLVGGGLGALAICAAGLLARPGGLLAWPGAEVWGHLWVQGWHADALPAWPSGTDLALGAAPWPVIDPLTTALAAILQRVMGPVLAWNLLVLGAVGLAFVGGVALARRVGGDPLVGGLALALAPPFLGSLGSGLSEDAALGLGALGLARLGGPRWTDGVLAGLALGMLAGCGLLLAWGVGLLALALGLKAWREEPRGRGPLLLAGALCLLLAAAWALPHLPRLGGLGHRSGSPPLTGFEPLWRLNPWRGVDLLSLLTPWPQDPGDALVRVHPGYLGLVGLGLAALGARTQRLRALLLLALLLASAGPTLRIAGQATGLDNPVALALAGVPGGALVNHHGRLLLPAALLFAPLAGLGAARLEQRWGPRIRAGVLAAMLLDLVVLAPGGAPLPLADPAVPPIITRLDELPPGPLLRLPLAGPGVHFQRALWEQRQHGRRLLLDPRQPSLPPGLLRTETGLWLSSLSGPGPALPSPAAPRLPGVRVLVVTGALVAPVEAGLGPPALQVEEGAAWAFDEQGAPSPAPQTR